MNHYIQSLEEFINKPNKACNSSFEASFQSEMIDSAIEQLHLYRKGRWRLQTP